MKVAILTYQGCSLWNAIGPMEMLLKANRVNNLIKEEAVEIEFRPLFVGSAKSVQTSYKYPIASHALIENNDKYELILIPGFDMDPLSVIKENLSVVDWLKKQYDLGASLVSFCTGAFLVGATGILDGKDATTHWLRANQFNEFFPDVNLHPDKLMIENKRILLSGGATSFQNMVLYIIEKYMGRKVALSMAKLYLIDINRNNQSQFAFLNAQKEHQDKPILKAQLLIERKYKDKLRLEDIAKKVAMSMRTFMRRFKKATGDTPLHYIQRVKVEMAKTILESESRTFEEIVYEVGYEDVNAFRKVFKKFTGVSPSDYRRMFNPKFIG